MPAADRRRRLPPFLTAIAVVVGVVGTACGDDGSAAGLRGIVRTPAPDVSGLSLPDVTADGAEFVFEAADGEVLLVYFGYTSCPDVCPTTMTDIQRAIGRLDAGDADRVSLAMATIDPARDTADVLTGYVRSIVPDGHAMVTTDDTRLRAVADAFGAFYGSELDDAGEPEVFHTGFLYAVDDEGRLAITWPFGVTTDDYEHDLRLLLDRA